MATLRLGRYEVAQYDLPPFCAKCGRKAAVSPDKTFAWSPGWLAFLILLGLPGLILYIIVAVVLTKRMTVPLPLCERHRNYWRNRAILVYGGLVAMLVLGVLGFIAAALLHEEGSGDSAFLIAGVGTGGLFVVWVFTAAIVVSGGIRSAEITERSITLSGLSRDFVDEVRLDRRGDEQDDEEDERDRAAKRRSRARAEENDDRGGYYDPDHRRRRGHGEDDDEDDR
jgi:hypothetical protein